MAVEVASDYKVTMKYRIVLASRNRKKSAEISDLLAPQGFEVVPVTEFPQVAEVVEDGDSFAANAAKKATQVAVAVGEWAIGEDSGLCVDALNGAPGIYSARFSGENATDERNNDKLLQELTGVPADKRDAEYVCSIVLSDPSGRPRVSAEGTCRGRIVDERRGTGGFGYDPLFLIPEFHRTFGELSPLVKQCLSHRARAFKKFVAGMYDVASDFQL
ncbi:MAG: RdgB/HAM1 family non-canonical purine NTP pyrophosphatase [Fuerstiella sp.]|nr:RdgB/HAM1 family non-canonical purine NTP pyrophosphatase [Fuerstiella sp.]